MTIHIAVCGLRSALLIQRFFPHPDFTIEYNDYPVETAGGASTTLYRRGRPTVLLLDSDSLEERAMMYQRAELEPLFNRGHTVPPNRLIFAVPQLEAVLFEDRAGLERALGRRMTDEEAFEARFRPRAVFERLLGGGDVEAKAEAVIAALDAAALRKMRRHPVIQEIEAFAREVRRGETPARARMRRAG
jgi:hypothetical protein